MTSLLPADCGFGTTVLSAIIPSFRQPRAHCRAAFDDAQTVPGYTVLGVLGRGGMAVVYKARQLGTKRLVAVKVIKRSLAGDREIVARFRQEQALGARLRHPNLIAVYEAGRAAGRPYLIMELVAGHNLKEFLRRSGPLTVAKACEIIRQAAVGLQHLHENGLVHRDVKPSNFMLTTDGKVKVFDLGLARHLLGPDGGERITLHGQLLGTLDYVAPEQCTDPHSVDIRADVYGLGCTLYELLAGQPPFARLGNESAFQKMRAHLEAPVPPIQERRPDVPEVLATALGRMLAKHRAGRFAGPADVVSAVQPFAACAGLADLAGTPAVSAA